jgi:hypothetical protein
LTAALQSVSGALSLSPSGYSKLPSAQFGSYTPDSFSLGDAGSLAANLAEFGSCKMTSLKVGAGTISLSNNEVRWLEGAVTAATLRSNAFQTGSGGSGPTSFMFSNLDLQTSCNLRAGVAVFEAGASLTTKYALSNTLATVSADLTGVSNIAAFSSNAARYASNQLPTFATSGALTGVSNIGVFASNVAQWASNQLPLYAVGSTVIGVSNIGVYASNAAQWSSNQVAGLVTTETQADFSNFITPVAVTGCNLGVYSSNACYNLATVCISNSAATTALSNFVCPIAVAGASRNGVFSNVSIGNSNAVGALSIRGTDSGGATPPNVDLFTTIDTRPVMQLLPYSHNNVSTCYDTYWDGAAWRSSSAQATSVFPSIAR